MNIWIIISTVVVYLALLFGVAYFSEQRSKAGRSIVNNPYVYALSLAVYCTAWTFYGSVGKASVDGIGFLPVYIGPILMMPLLYFLLRKIIYISNYQRLSSIADFISSRYGKSTRVGIVVTLIAIFGIVPYISIQLKGIANSFNTLAGAGLPSFMDGEHFYGDTAFYVAIVLVAFIILFGARHLDATERHEGLVAVIVLDSIIKLVAFLAVGIFITFFVYDGFGDIFNQASLHEATKDLLVFDGSLTTSNNWLWTTLIAMFAIVCLPRQFHISVVENFDSQHINKALWLFPLYLLLINIFVIPIAIGGLLTFTEGRVNPDFFVLEMPIHYNNNLIALLVFIGGISAATGMVIISTMALSVMISNNLLTPALIKTSIMRNEKITDVFARLLSIRRLSIIFVVIFSYGYFKMTNRFDIVSIGLISFVAVAQFAPSLLGGLFWTTGNRKGAVWGMIIGAMVWFYTLVLPTVMSGSFITEGLFGWHWLRPTALFGIQNMDAIMQGAFWSLLFNTICYVVISLNTSVSPLERTQADLFVNIQKYMTSPVEYEILKRKASIHDIKFLLNRFVGEEGTNNILEEYAAKLNINLEEVQELDAEFINNIEALLSGGIGVASARSLIASIVKEDPISMAEVMQILDETQEIMQYSKALEKKSTELETTTVELKIANSKLQELDKLKDDFIATITHELRTPITSIKAFAKILKDNELPEEQQSEFLTIMMNESERITRLINQVLDLKKIQAGDAHQDLALLNLNAIVIQSLASVSSTLEQKNIALYKNLHAKPLIVNGDQDRLVQVIVNLLSNAIKFCDDENGKIAISTEIIADQAVIKVRDNGIGVPKEKQAIIFDRFTQIGNKKFGKPTGSGLGLFITKMIVNQHKGTIEMTNEEDWGATLEVRLPLSNA